jgi:hypothetical protein
MNSHSIQNTKKMAKAWKKHMSHEICPLYSSHPLPGRSPCAMCWEAKIEMEAPSRCRSSIRGVPVECPKTFLEWDQIRKS